MPAWSRVQRCHCVSQRCDALEHEHVCVMCLFIAVPVAEDRSLGRDLRSNVNIMSNQVSVFSHVARTKWWTASSSKEYKANRSVDVALLQSSIVEQSLCTLMERRQLRRSLVHSACVLSSRCRRTAEKSAARPGVGNVALACSKSVSLSLSASLFSLRPCLCAVAPLVSSVCCVGEKFF